MQIHPSHNTVSPAASKVLAFRPEEVQAFGLKGAIVLNQIRYWTDPKRCKNNKEGRYWVYNSVKAWHEQFGTLSERTLRRILKHLEDLNVIITKKFNAWRRDQRKWYTINVEQLKALIKAPQEGIRSRHNHSSPPDPEPPQESETNFVMLEKEVLTDEIHALSSLTSSSSEAKNGGNVDVATLADCTCGHSDRISKETENAQKNISLFVNQQNKSSDSWREMIDTWNKIIEDQPDAVALTYWRKRGLRKAFETQFHSSSQAWQNYCQLIAHNTFLMGQGPNKWKVSLDWALRPQNIQKVQEKSYTGQQEILQPSTSPLFSKEDLVGSETWKRMATLLVQRLGTSTFNAWLAESSLEEERAEHPILRFKNQFKADRVQQQFSQTIEAVAREVMPHMKYLCLKA